jgi:ParB-like chromosome segregation protein Spo0J
MSQEAVKETIALDNIEATAATQVRVKLDHSKIDEYTEDYQAGADFPALVVYREANSERNILADGFHRQRAAINAGKTEHKCLVYEGGMKDALIHALGANTTHGLRRTNADKRNAVMIALKDPELSQLKQVEIADICAVTDRTVRKIIAELAAKEEPENRNGSGSEPQPPTDEDYRDDGNEPTQEDVDLGELRQALGLIHSLPYDGALAAGKLALEKGDIERAEYASSWLAGLVIEARKDNDADKA